MRLFFTGTSQSSDAARMNAGGVSAVTCFWFEYRFGTSSHYAHRLLDIAERYIMMAARHPECCAIRKSAENIIKWSKTTQIFHLYFLYLQQCLNKVNP